MRIVDLLSAEKIALHAPAVADKAAMIEFLVDLQDKGGCLSDKAGYPDGPGVPAG